MRKIEFWRTVSAAYIFLFGDLGRFIVAAGGWLVAIALTVIAVSLLFLVSAALASLAGFVGVLVFYFGGTFAFAVSWHRAILRSEQPQMTIHFGRREWRFLGYSLLIGLISAGSILVGWLVFGTITAGLTAVFGEASVFSRLLFPVVGIVGWGIFARLSLALPAAAIDEPGGQLRAAWHRAKGNGVRLFFGPIVCTLPIIVLQFVVQFLLGPPISPAAPVPEMSVFRPGGAQIAFWLFWIVSYFVQTGLAVGFLSFSYRQITYYEGPPQPA